MGPNNESYDELDRFRAPSSLGNPPGDWPPSSAEDSWRCFRFSKAKVAELKELGSKYCKEEGVEYISSNDAVTAFIWQRFMIARIKLGLPIEGESTLIRAINARAKARPPIPKAYMGHVILCGNAAVPMASFIDPTLYHPVHELRRSLQDVSRSGSAGSDKANSQRSVITKSPHSSTNSRHRRIEPCSITAPRWSMYQLPIKAD